MTTAMVSGLALGADMADTGISADWLRLPFGDFIALSRTAGDVGWSFDQASAFLRQPALSSVNFDVVWDDRRMVTACEIVHRTHIAKYAPEYIRGADLAIWARFFPVAPGRDYLEEAFCAYMAISPDHLVRTSIGLPKDAPEDIEKKSEAVALRYFSAFLGLQGLLLRGGVSAERRKARAPAGRIKLDSGTRVPLPSKIHILNLGLGGRSMSEAVDHVARLYAPRVRRCAAWKVRGFYRHLKSGAEVYVRPHVRGPDRDSVKPADRELVY